jgi:hypothetical protein
MTSSTQRFAGMGGAVLEAIFAVFSRLRPAAKPLHSRGSVMQARIVRTGLSQPVGVPWLDEAGADDLVVRFSRGVGLPPRLPDILGMAIRVDPGGRFADLLFSTTGRGRRSRFILIPRRRYAPAFYGTLMPYRSPSGPVLLGASARAHADGVGVELFVAAPRDPWRSFGSFTVPSAPVRGQDRPVTFDPVAHYVPGLEPYDWVRKLREGAYAAARRARGDRRRPAAVS